MDFRQTTSCGEEVNYRAEFAGEMAVQVQRPCEIIAEKTGKRNRNCGSLGESTVTLASCRIVRRLSFSGAAHTRSRPSRRFTHVNILLVEDHEDSRSVLANLLTHCGHEVAMASNLTGALELLDHLRFDILVSDIELPDGSGLDLVVEAKKRQTWKKTIALTAHGQSAEREMGRRAGYDEYLTKPFDFYRLRSIIAASQ